MTNHKSGLSDGVLVRVDGVEKVYQRGSEDVHVLANLDQAAEVGLELPLGQGLVPAPSQLLDRQVLEPLDEGRLQHAIGSGGSRGGHGFTLSGCAPSLPIFLAPHALL